MVFGSGVHCPDCGHGDVVRPTQGAAIACARARSRGMRIRKRGAGGEQPPKSKAAAAVPRRPRPGGGQPGRKGAGFCIPTRQSPARRSCALRHRRCPPSALVGPLPAGSRRPARCRACGRAPRRRLACWCRGSTGQASREPPWAPGRMPPVGSWGAAPGCAAMPGGNSADPAAWPRRPRLCAEAPVRGGGGASRRYSYMPISPRHAR